jgi:DNA topoisomerase-1
LFPGFLRAYVEGSDDPEAALEDKEVLLPPLKVKDQVRIQAINPESHETKPPARFTEASLVQILEKEGIGRPSTYASIIDTILDRGYVRKQGNALIPTFTGFAVTQFLEKNFAEVVDLGFTSKMEQSLDEIAEGNLESVPYLKNFYLGKNGLKAQVDDREKKIDPEESRSIILENLKGIPVKVGRFGPYVSNGGANASIPEDIAPADVTEQLVKDVLAQSKEGPKPIGVDPKTGLGIFCLLGRFGPYVQLGLPPDEPKEKEPKPAKKTRAKGQAKEAKAPAKDKPRRASVPRGVDPKTVTLEMALKWLSMPRELGLHPVSGQAILANVGRFGPYVVHQKDFRSLKKTDDVYTVDLKRALELLSEEKKGRGGSTMLKELGAHPADGKPVAIYEGRYGTYVKHGALNATLPKDTNPANLALVDALALLKEREARGGAAGGRGARRRGRGR